MKYFMSVDGGGTKIQAVLFDEKFRCLGFGRGGAVNNCFSSSDDVQAAMTICINHCLKGHEVKFIDKVYVSMAGPADVFLRILKERITVLESIRISEGKMGLLAGIHKKRGCVALAGTGSAVYRIDNDDEICMGGMGGLLGDEGSGYYIGREGLIRCIRYWEGRGPYTKIIDILKDEWNVNDSAKLRDRVYGAPAPRVAIASAAHIVAKAAGIGDELAISIYTKAGWEMADQLIALVNKVKLDLEVDVVICGGAWKGCGAMYNEFNNVLINSSKSVSACIPAFEPVMGGVVAEYHIKNTDSNNDFIEFIKGEFDAFRYRTQWG